MSFGRFAVYSVATGRIDRVLGCTAPEAEASCAPGEAAIQVDLERDDTHYVDAGALTPFPLRPSPSHHWDWITHTWLAT